jgi:hypothetical protein
MKHGKRKSRVYKTWCNMIQRCNNKNNNTYAYYGGRGIVISPDWLVFENFYHDMGDPPAGLTLDRLDNNQGYSTSNCRWADRSAQMHNRRYQKRGGFLNSKYRGVQKQKRGNKFLSTISLGNKAFRFCSIPIEEDAAVLYDFCALMFFGENAITNFAYKQGAGEL